MDLSATYYYILILRIFINYIINRLRCVDGKDVNNVQHLLYPLFLLSARFVISLHNKSNLSSNYLCVCASQLHFLIIYYLLTR